MHAALEFYVRNAIQYKMLKSWNEPQRDSNALSEQFMLRGLFPSLFTVTRAIPPSTSPEDVGRFFALVNKVAIAIMEYAIHYVLADFDVQAHCDDLERYLVEKSTIDVQHLRLYELEDLVDSTRRIDLATVRDFYGDMVNLEHDERVEAIARTARCLCMGLLYAMINEPGHCKKFHSMWNFRQWVRFTRSFRREFRNYIRVDPHLFPVGDEFQADDSPVQFEVNNTAAEYVPTGPAVPAAAFCEPADNVPQGSECTVCMTEVEAGADEEPAVVTRCQHFFHEMCLTAWVNESAMETSNTCPSCRGVLCEPRERKHLSEDANQS